MLLFSQVSQMSSYVKMTMIERCLFWSFLLVTFIGCCGENNILKNPDFEDEFGADDWWCSSCTLTRSTDAYSGQYSALVTARENSMSSLRQTVYLERATSYYFTLMIKLVSQQPGEFYYSGNVCIVITYPDGAPQEVLWTGRMNTLRADDGWVQTGGDLTLRARVHEMTEVFIEIFNPDVDYLVDSTSLTRIYYNPNWREEALLRIDQIRKNDIEIELELSETYDYEDLEIKLEQTRSDFPFGSAVAADRIVNSGSQNELYRETFLEFFEWAVIENHLKWDRMEWERFNIDFSMVDNALDKLEEMGNIPVRGHNIMWGKPDRMPGWLEEMADEDVKGEVLRRVDYLMEHYKDRENLVHWDVYNEQMHYPYYEERTSDPHLLKDVHRRAHEGSPDVLLFLNDFQAVTSTYYTDTYVNQALELLAEGVPVHGLGVQCHREYRRWYPFTDPEKPNLLEHRMNRLAKAGLPIWVTEMDFEDEDVSVRANGYDIMLTLFFSLEQVEGIMLWGFWDQAHWKPNAALVEGSNFEKNEAGERVLHLLRTEWRTNVSLCPFADESRFTVRGFHGAYDVIVLNQGEEIHRQQFYLPKGQDVAVKITV